MKGGAAASGLRIHLLCHGETDHGSEGFFCGSGTDSPLTAAGQRAARSFSAAYAGHPFLAVYSSSLARAMATAAPIAAASGLAVLERAGLKDLFYGEWEGRSAKNVAAQFDKDYARWRMNPSKHPPTGGEKATDVADRGGKVIRELQAAFPAGDVLVVSHAATIRILLCSLLGINVGLFRHRLACPSGSLSQVDLGGHGFQLRKLGDRSHIEAAQDVPASA